MSVCGTGDGRATQPAARAPTEKASLHPSLLGSLWANDPTDTQFLHLQNGRHLSHRLLRAIVLAGHQVVGDQETRSKNEHLKPYSVPGIKKFKCSLYFLVSTTLRQALIWSAFCKWRSQVSNPGGHLTPKAHALHQKMVTTVGPENDPEGARPSQQTGWGLPFSSSISLHPMQPPLSALRGKSGLLGAPNPCRGCQGQPKRFWAEGRSFQSLFKLCSGRWA